MKNGIQRCFLDLLNAAVLGIGLASLGIAAEGVTSGEELCSVEFIAEMTRNSSEDRKTLKLSDRRTLRGPNNATNGLAPFGRTKILVETSPEYAKSISDFIDKAIDHPVRRKFIKRLLGMELGAVTTIQEVAKDFGVRPPVATALRERLTVILLEAGLFKLIVPMEQELEKKIADQKEESKKARAMAKAKANTKAPVATPNDLTSKYSQLDSWDFGAMVKISDEFKKHATAKLEALDLTNQDKDIFASFFGIYGPSETILYLGKKHSIDRNIVPEKRDQVLSQLIGAILGSDFEDSLTPENSKLPFAVSGEILAEILNQRKLDRIKNRAIFKWDRKVHFKVEQILVEKESQFIDQELYIFTSFFGFRGQVTHSIGEIMTLTGLRESRIDYELLRAFQIVKQGLLAWISEN